MQKNQKTLKPKGICFSEGISPDPKKKSNDISFAELPVVFNPGKNPQTKNTTGYKRGREAITNYQEEEINVQSRVKALYEDGKWYMGKVKEVKKSKRGEVISVIILFDDGDEEKCNWPDENILVIDK